VQPAYAEAHYALGTTLQQQGQTDTALASFRESLKYAPNVPATHNALGTALKQKGELQAAQAAFDEAQRLTQIKARQEAAWLSYRNGLARLRENKPDEAMQLLRTAISQDPDHAQAHLQLGKILKQRGLLKEAAAELEKAKALNLRRNTPAGNDE
jgi:tetratricopeptide (TPR) repeat protein